MSLSFKFSIGHSSSLYESEELLMAAESFYPMIPNDVTRIIVASSSGMSLASAVLMLAAKEKRNINVCYIKKNKYSFRLEESCDENLGNQISPSGYEYSLDKGEKAIFIDDLIDRGLTLEACNEYWKGKFHFDIDYVAVSNVMAGLGERYLKKFWNESGNNKHSKSHFSVYLYESKIESKYE